MTELHAGMKWREKKPDLTNGVVRKRRSFLQRALGHLGDA
jgi:hypothetical protein